MCTFFITEIPSKNRILKRNAVPFRNLPADERKRKSEKISKARFESRQKRSDKNQMNNTKEINKLLKENAKEVEK